MALSLLVLWAAFVETHAARQTILQQPSDQESIGEGGAALDPETDCSALCSKCPKPRNNFYACTGGKAKKGCQDKPWKLGKACTSACICGAQRAYQECPEPPVLKERFTLQTLQGTWAHLSSGECTFLAREKDSNNVKVLSFTDASGFTNLEISDPNYAVVEDGTHVSMVYEDTLGYNACELCGEHKYACIDKFVYEWVESADSEDENSEHKKPVGPKCYDHVPKVPGDCAHYTACK